MEEKNLDYYIRLLEANKNLILTGAPGTGKTYLAKAIADKMEAEYEFVQFHPSYDYTDFVEGLRPTPPDKNGNIGFERKDGMFKEFCKRAIEKCKGLSTESSINISKNSIDENDKIEKAMSWLMKQNGATLKSIRSETKFTLVINQNRIYLRIPKGNENYVNPNGVIRYLKTGEYDKEHQTYEPSVGFFIKENCPLYTKDTSNNHILHKDILPPKEKQFVLENRKEEKIKHFIFIIDEINRGEISKIFGELFFSIDPSYRGEKGLVKTQYQNLITDESDPFYEGFYVPENVYIIGTMNDIDRSVESMDFAMRRRFAWVEIKANEHTEMLDEELADMKEEIVQVMTRLNAAIWDEENHTGIEGLSPAYHIGGSYFSKLALYLDNERTHKEAAYKHLWENHLKGVLFEYLRGTANAMENLEMLEQVYYQKEGKDDIEG
ncbi:AAA family ATPase [uncultured Bacteroides sp.]|uniref:AAA family ATPase n=1 Tax=uncultured Bacteroides sp. TaxID=162156 RepID=UPI00280A70C0|nr:AAA family ATPase [uncultured Bacteroides sp.]